MEDVLTETPPPSRFHQEDLDNFAPPPAPFPSPFLALPGPQPTDLIRPSLLIVAISSPSLQIFHRLPSKTAAGALFLPETPFSGNSLDPSLRDNSCNLYSLLPGALLVSVQCPVAADRAHAVAELLVGGRISPERVVVFDSVRRRNFRSALPPDDGAALAFKLETSAERRRRRSGAHSLEGPEESFPSGSVVEGLSAALLGRCEMRNVRGTLFVTWPESGAPAVSLVESLVRRVSPDLDLSFRTDAADEFSRKGRVFDSELYT